jgi:PKD repeat protein
LTRRIATAIMMCAVMVLVAAVPLALAETHTITKGEKGPNASAVTWSFTAPDYGIWTGHIVNNGLRWVVVDVVDDSSGMAMEIMHQRIRFAAVGAYPQGELTTDGAIMALGRTYSITITPNGPKGSSCDVTDMFEGASPPVAVISPPVVDFLTVSVDGSQSHDTNPGGSIVSFDWNFGDNAAATGPTASHTYAAAGDYTIMLTVTDNDGLTDSASVIVTAIDVPPSDRAPVALFTVSINKLVVSVDGSASYDPDIGDTVVSYAWNFGDGATATGVAASHTYATWGTWLITLTVTDSDGTPGSASTPVTVSNPSSPPPPPISVFGYVTDSLGGLVFGAEVTITDVNTGAVWTAVTDNVYAYYMIDLNSNETGWAYGDTMQVAATSSLMTGSSVGVILGAYVQIDVVVI